MLSGEYPHTAVWPGSHRALSFANSLEEDPGARIQRAHDREWQLLARMGIARPWLERFSVIARQNGTTIEAELLASGLVTEDAWYAGLARMLSLPFAPVVDHELVDGSQQMDVQLACPRILRLAYMHRKPEYAIVPEAARLDELIEAIFNMPSLRQSLIVTTPSAVKNAVWKAGEQRRIRDTVNGLFDRHPQMSARVVFQGQQGFLTGAAITMLVIGLVLAPESMFLPLHVAFSMFYLSAMLLRLSALLHRRRRSVSRLPAVTDDSALPVYTILVALYREEAVCEQLVTTLGRISWPRSRLDIKLVCEADDRGTIEKLRGILPGAHFEIIEVPDSAGPRTKPRALSYALPAVRGDYVAIYDAEDRPHPGQLREAHARFTALPENVACLQAPLIITNARRSCISALFSLEYSALFRGFLPMLADYRMPLPLGGTSNHFRTAALRAAGGWDPYNVTEDADISMRFYRMGYRSDVLTCQTLEDAPDSIPVWMAQRARWFKGWLQTWLVMTRTPLQTAGEMGWQAYALFQLMIGGMLISSLAHPLIYAGLARSALATATDSPVTPLAAILFIVDICNIAGSYLLFVWLGRNSMVAHERRQIGWKWAFVPVYWLLLSVAAWRALFELKYRPFHWNKTPHKPVTTS